MRINNGYYMVYKPEHPKAKSEGYIYYHILVAEEMIGRNLTKQECVHHIDKDRLNNNINNLIIFVSNSAHSAYHRGGILISTSNKHIYDCKSQNSMAYCKECGNKCSSLSKHMLCIDCYNIYQRKVNNRPTKEYLTQLLLNNTYVSVGKMFGVSDNTIRKWLK